MMKSQTKVCVCFTKINIKLISGAPKVQLIQQVAPLTNIKKSLLRLSE